MSFDFFIKILLILNFLIEIKKNVSDQRDSEQTQRKDTLMAYFESITAGRGGLDSYNQALNNQRYAN
ncbi:hypothetical protein JT229_07145, partial [Helicobacter pylori]|nr:hypothetical protein [Helicobacter pylori]